MLIEKLKVQKIASHLRCIYVYHSAVKPCHMVHLRQNCWNARVRSFTLHRNPIEQKKKKRKKPSYITTLADDEKKWRAEKEKNDEIYKYITWCVDIIDNNSHSSILNGTRKCSSSVSNIHDLLIVLHITIFSFYGG